MIRIIWLKMEPFDTAMCGDERRFERMDDETDGWTGASAYLPEGMLKRAWMHNVGNRTFTSFDLSDPKDKALYDYISARWGIRHE